MKTRPTRTWRPHLAGAGSSYTPMTLGVPGSKSGIVGGHTEQTYSPPVCVRGKAEPSIPGPGNSPGNRCLALP